jgi:hypothetical protein
MLRDAPTAVRRNSVGIWALETLRQSPLKLHNSKIMTRFGEGEAMSILLHFKDFLYRSITKVLLQHLEHLIFAEGMND